MKITTYRRAGRSPFVYISFPDPITGERRQQATPFRFDDPEGTRKARLLAQKLAAGEKESTDHERFDLWVLPFLERQYQQSPKTLLRYTGAWSYLGQFLADRKIVVPRAITYRDVRDFHAWRCSLVKHSKRTVSWNTALLDVKVLGLVMGEAVRRGFADSNPAFRHGIRKQKARGAHEIMPDEMALIERELPGFVAKDTAARKWMPDCWAIARYQGCRLRETRLHLRRQVDLRAGTITFVAKGHNGVANEFTTQLHPQLVPLFSRMIADKREYSLDHGPRPSILWRKFFDSIGLKHVWFHCLRSTVATEMARAGVPISQAMRFVGHASEVIHRQYQRLQTGDLKACVMAVGGTPPLDRQNHDSGEANPQPIACR